MAELVLVTGGSGYIAGWCIAELLRRGYEVRTTVRDPGREQAVADAMSSVAGRAGRLSFAVADLTADDGWDAALKGVDYVLHVASPLGGGTADAMIAAARDGTLRVLRAAVAARAKRVVMTSAANAASPGRRRPQGADPAGAGCGGSVRGSLHGPVAAGDHPGARPPQPAHHREGQAAAGMVAAAGPGDGAGLRQEPHRARGCLGAAVPVRADQIETWAGSNAMCTVLDSSLFMASRSTVWRSRALNEATTASASYRVRSGYRSGGPPRPAPRPGRQARAPGTRAAP